jgi:hypothetical protein
MYLKIFVGLLWILDTAHQAVISHVMYTYLVTHFSQVEFLSVIVK